MIFPFIRPIADLGVSIEFGDQIDDSVHARVLATDAAILSAALDGVTETVPTYTAIFVGYDPLMTDYATLHALLLPLLQNDEVKNAVSEHWQVPACYHSDFAPDMPELSDALDLRAAEIIKLQTSAIYKVYMYGFAPGYAYLGGVPRQIQFPRKEQPTMGVASNSVMIAGAQALITTIEMPSGWWVIGKSAISPLQDDPDRPFLFNVGDTVEFVAMERHEFDDHCKLLSKP